MMPYPDHDVTERWRVIVNLEDECAVWAARRPLPAHWRPLGVSGTRAQCEAHITSLDRERHPDVLRRRLERDRVLP